MSESDREAFRAVMRSMQSANGCRVTGGVCREAGQCGCFRKALRERDLAEFNRDRG